MSTKMFLEGGNVVPDAKPITRKNVQTVVKNLQGIMPKGINVYPIGSAGKKDVSSDMDVLIDAAELMKIFPVKDLKTARQGLENYFKENGYFAARTGVSVHVGIPTGEDGNVTQVDIMAVENARDVVPLHTHDYSKDPAMKGGTLHGIWADLTNMSSLPDHPSLMMSPYKGLVDRETKELITSNKDQIAKIIIGPNASAEDMGSVHSILSALRSDPNKYKAIKDKWAPNLELNENIHDWFRRTMNLLK
jgi:hypothetical protein